MITFYEKTKTKTTVSIKETPKKVILHKKKSRGFTLIELMIVMAIIAILATAGISTYMNYIRKAQDTVTLGLMNQIKLIVTARESTPDYRIPTAAELQVLLEAEGLALDLPTSSPLVATLSSLSLPSILGLKVAYAQTIALKNAPGGICNDGNQCMIGYVTFSTASDPATPLYYGIFANFRSNKTDVTGNGMHTIAVAGVGNVRASFISNHPAITPMLADNNGMTALQDVTAVTQVTPNIAVSSMTPIKTNTNTQDPGYLACQNYGGSWEAGSCFVGGTTTGADHMCYYLGGKWESNNCNFGVGSKYNCEQTGGNWYYNYSTGNYSCDNWVDGSTSTTMNGGNESNNYNTRSKCENAGGIWYASTGSEQSWCALDITTYFYYDEATSTSNYGYSYCQNSGGSWDWNYSQCNYGSTTTNYYGNTTTDNYQYYNCQNNGGSWDWNYSYCNYYTTSTTDWGQGMTTADWGRTSCENSGGNWDWNNWYCNYNTTTTYYNPYIPPTTTPATTTRR